ncbi:MAG: histidine phosphatase family protein [Gammaproteobacteria bacterium]|nr:MAG: histidine phosphatase family protein [Gammaproteobacteria bacterium]
MSSEPKEYRQTRFERPPGATEILLIRHGESRAATPDDPFPLVDGHGDPELHANGQEQARRVGERLKGQPITAVYVSNLRRTHETAAPLCAHLGLEPRIDPDLREVFLGEWEGGLLRIKAHQNDPIIQEVFAKRRWDVIPGAESPESLTERLSRSLNRIAAAHPDELVAAFVHGGVIGHILSDATGARPFSFNGADNGSISHIVMTEGQILVRRFNDSTHLHDEISTAEAQMT